MVRHERGGAFITMPHMYPGGGAVLIWIDRHLPHFTVSDFGLTARECELMGDDRHQFRRLAEPMAQASGLQLGLDDSLSVVVSGAQLAGAIKTVATTSLEVCQTFANRKRQRARNGIKAVLLTRLIRVFGKSGVSSEVEFRGASETAWQIDAMVKHGDRTALFDVVSPFFPSVASTLAKYGDIRLMNDAPIRASVLDENANYGSWLTALAQAGRVIPKPSDDESYRRALQ